MQKKYTPDQTFKNLGYAFNKITAIVIKLVEFPF